MSLMVKKCKQGYYLQFSSTFISFLADFMHGKYAQVKLVES